MAVPGAGEVGLGSIVATVGSGWHRAVNDVTSWGHSVTHQLTALDVAALIVASVALLAYVAITTTGRRDRGLAAALEPYQLHERRPQPVGERDGEGPLAMPAVRRMSATLAAFARRRGFEEALARQLQRAGLPIGVGELLTIWVALAVVLLAVGGILVGLFGVVIALIIAVLVPIGVLQALANRRSRQFEAQIPDVLKLLAASLRAGFSLLQGLDSIIYQIKDPMASELRQAFAVTRLGTPVEEALEAAANRVGSRDFTWTVTAIRIQREVGGNLAEILDTVAATMTERERLRREVRTLTAEGRISAIILGLLPLAMGFLIFLVNRPYVETLFNTFGGEIALLGGVLLELAGVWWLYRTVQIEI